MLFQYCFAVISFCAALGFLIYGGRLFVLLRRFPVESRSRQNKLYEVRINVQVVLYISILEEKFIFLIWYWIQIMLQVSERKHFFFDFYETLSLYVIRKWYYACKVHLATFICRAKNSTKYTIQIVINIAKSYVRVF